MIKRYKHKVLNSTIEAVRYDGSHECIDHIIEMLKTSIGINNTECALYIQNRKWPLMKARKGDFVCKNALSPKPFIIPGNKMLTMYEEMK